MSQDTFESFNEDNAPEPSQDVLVYSISPEDTSTLYVNLTNHCTNNCVFCIRSQKDDVCGKNMWLKSENIELNDVISQFLQFDTPENVVFCGYGEPLLKLDLLKEFATYLKENYPEIKIRINTNGHANFVWGRNIIPELIGLIDEISVSLNAPTTEIYNELSQPKISNAFETVQDFITLSADAGIKTVASVVDGYKGRRLDIASCENLATKLGAEFRVREWIQEGY